MSGSDIGANLKFQMPSKENISLVSELQGLKKQFTRDTQLQIDKINTNNFTNSIALIMIACRAATNEMDIFSVLSGVTFVQAE